MYYYIPTDFIYGVEIETLQRYQVLPLYQPVMLDYSEWAQVYDSTIDCSGEFVSPILHGMEGIKSISDMCAMLQSLRTPVDNRCGLHVHISRKCFKTIRAYENFVDLYELLESSLDELVKPHRRGNANSHAKSIVNCEITSRYFKVNLENTDTVEVRHYHGTVDANEIYRWVCVLHSLVEYSNTARVIPDEIALKDVVPNVLYV